jgi:hypothetical protein
MRETKKFIGVRRQSSIREGLDVTQAIEPRAGRQIRRRAETC